MACFFYLSLFCLSLAPSGPPQLVSAQDVSPTYVILAWDPPLLEVRNGIIQNYIIRIIELETGRALNLSTTTTSINVTSLHPYYNYNCTVAAVTSGTGPFSPHLVIQLPEDGVVV